MEEIAAAPTAVSSKTKFAEVKKTLILKSGTITKCTFLNLSLKKDFEINTKAYNNIGKNLGSKTGNIFLVIKNLPSDNYEVFQDDRKSLQR